MSRTSQNSRPLHLQTIDSLFAELIGGASISVGENGSEFRFEHADSRSILNWYRLNRSKWDGNVMTADVEEMVSAMPIAPPTLPIPDLIVPKGGRRLVIAKVVAHRFAGVHAYGTAEAPPPDFVFEPRETITLFEGWNGAGKTSFLNTIIWCLTGELIRPQRQTRKLVEQDEVAAILNPLGTPTGLSVRKYLNDKKVPQLFVAAGATLWGDYAHYPFSIGFQPSYQAETAVYAKYLLEKMPDARVALFYQNDDAGKDYGNGFKKGLGPENTAKMVVTEATYESTDPTIDSQIVKLKASGANVLFMHAIPKQAAQAIKKIGEIGWKPDIFFLAATSTSIASVMKPAGFEHSQGIISSYTNKDPNDPQWKADKDVADWWAFMKAYMPDGNTQDQLIVYGYVVAEATVQVLKQCGDDLTQENIMAQAANLDIALPMLLPGIRVKTSKTDYFPVQSMRLQRFKGETWELFGDTIGGDG